MLSRLKMAAFGRCLYKKSCDLNCQVFVNTDADLTPQSVCLACNHLAAFHEQGSVNPDEPPEKNDVKASSSKLLQGNPQNSKSNPTSTFASGSYGKAKSLTEWLRDKKSNEYRQTNQAKKKKVDRNRREEGDELVTINIGLMEYKGNQLKKVWGKRLPIKIPKCSTYVKILETARVKWSAYYSNLMQDKDYVLLYEDGNRALFMPGGCKELFDLSKYKEELGRDYRRICLYLCTEDDFDAAWESCNSLCSDNVTEEKVSFLFFYLCLVVFHYSSLQFCEIWKMYELDQIAFCWKAGIIWFA